MNRQPAKITKVLRHVDSVFSYIEQATTRMLPNLYPQHSMPLQISLIGYLKKVNRHKQLSVQSPSAARIELGKAMQTLCYGFPVAAWHDLSIDLATHSLAARHYVPEDKNRLPALLVYFHGGGFVIGDLDTHDDICRFLCQQAGMQVLSVAYRLAPEHPFPAGLNDARSALAWVQQHAKRFNVKPDQIAVAGDSAGANYAAILSQEFGQQLLASLLIYPSTDRSRKWPSAQRFAHSAFLSDMDRAWFYQHYLTNVDANVDIQVSPLLKIEQQNAEGKPLGLPNTILVTGGHDVLQDEGIAYANAMKQGGTLVEHLHFSRLDHGFMHFIGINKTAYQAAKQVCTTFRIYCQQGLAG